jgi:hypothetical protein
LNNDQAGKVSASSALVDAAVVLIWCQEVKSR